MSTNGNCPTNTAVLPRAFTGEANAEFSRNGVVSHTYSSTTVVGGKESFGSYKGSEGIEMRFVPPLVDGETTLVFDAQSGRFTYVSAGKVYYISGVAEVDSKNSGDDLLITFSGEFSDGSRMIDIKGKGELHYTFP